MTKCSCRFINNIAANLEMRAPHEPVDLILITDLSTCKWSGDIMYCRNLGFSRIRRRQNEYHTPRNIISASKSYALCRFIFQHALASAQAGAPTMIGFTDTMATFSMMGEKVAHIYSWPTHVIAGRWRCQLVIAAEYR